MRTLAALILLGSAAAPAQERGDVVLHAGWAWLRPASAETPRVTTQVTPSPGTLLLGIPERFESTGVTLAPSEAQTLGFGATYFLTPALAVALDLGIPPVVEARGAGRAGPPGPSGALFETDLADPSMNPLGSQRQWSPVLALQYRFRPDTRLRPFLAVGASYTWFTQTRLHPGFTRHLDERYGQYLATSSGHPGPTQAEARTPSLWAPVAGAGVSLALSPRWSLVAGLGYARFKAQPALTLRAQDGTPLFQSVAQVEVDAIVTNLAVAWRWRRGED